MADAPRPPDPRAIIAVRGACEHNLNHVDVDIPRGVLAVVTGVSGSGKSSLAFDTICAEGRRRYLETFSSYARQFLGRVSRPAVTSITGLAPAVALDQSTIVRNPRSTVGTLTELHDLLRLLWARFGTVPAEHAGLEVARQLFSFNSPHGACPACGGLGVEDRLDPELLIANPDRTVRGGALRITTPTGYLIYSQVTIDVLDQVCRAHGFSVDVPWKALTADQRDIILNGSDRIRIPYGKHPLASRMKWTGITAKPREEGVYRGILPVMEQILRQKRNDNILRFVRTMPCRACGGTRLRPEALSVRYRGRTIADAAAMSALELRGFIGGSTDRRTDGIRDHIIERCDVLEQLGLGYLTLDRASTSLSGGEAQRLRLAKQVSVGLGGLLYVLDEPSIGLHPRDTARLLTVLRAIRDRGNTVLVVEHDDDTIFGADWVVDVGPGPGKDGGSVLFSGPLASFTTGAIDSQSAERLAASRTRAFLTGRERIDVPRSRRPGSGTLRVSGVTAHNLRDVDVTFLLGGLNAVSGVSGAGKSTLVAETARLVEPVASSRAATDSPAPGIAEGGARATASARIGKVISIDQSPIGRTPRSNPATYTGLFDNVRDLFAAEPDAVRLGYAKGRFSFNVAGGRCEACEGAGVQQFGMQFLGVVSVPCDACGGRRFNDATLSVRYQGQSIHDVLAMSITEARAFFAGEPVITRVLDTLVSLGLGYLPLGHPATMLSGGEAQRVKLATELARSVAAHTLYVLDEPTTGLHQVDIARLLTAIDGLIARGHTVIAIEHHLDVLAAADRVVDLGPGSGAEGGRVVVCGTPEEVAAFPESATAPFLRAHLDGRRSPVIAPPMPPAPEATSITFTGVSTHNLQHIDVSFPRNQLIVVTGVSGSGKSSLAFDTLFAEGQQRYSETLSAWARRFVRHAGEAEFHSVTGLTATVAVRQQAPSSNPRSTVATLTEIHDTCRLLFSRAGVRTCPTCGVVLTGHTCPACGFEGTPTLTAAMFSPNSETGACQSCHGLGHVMVCDPARLITNPGLPLAGGAMNGHKTGRFYGDPRGQHMATLASAATARHVNTSGPWQDLTLAARDLALRGAGEGTFDVEWAYERGARRGVHRFTSLWPGLLELVRQEFDRKHGDHRGEAIAELMVPDPCRDCGGARLRPEPRAVQFGGVPMHAVLARSVDESLAFFAGIEAGTVMVSDRMRRVSADLRDDIVVRLRRLKDAGLGYLALDRPATTLSAGEAQRVRLASQLQSGLTGITYVLDEPTAGLHPRDTHRLLGLLRDLRDSGNTVVVVEHDPDVVRAADHVIELGPGAGAHGGRIALEGPPDTIAGAAHSATGAHLRARRGVFTRACRPLLPGLAIRGARVHNLAGLDVDIPAGGLVAVTGVSGSGKSSLIFDVLGPSVARRLEPGGAASAPVHCASLTMLTPFRSVVDVGPVAAGVSPWSTPATHTGVFDAVRDLFAATAAARARGLRKSHFSAATKGGRCESCEGRGQIRISMDFLPDVWSVCEDCGGLGYGPDVLACLVEGRSIAEVLAMRIGDARVFFGMVEMPVKAGQSIARGLQALDDVGLGYVPLGQQTRTLSGGERQRLVLAGALAGRVDAPALYLMDEPTTGLHVDDVRHLLDVFDRLTRDGHTVIVVEHHLDVIAAADWVIDLGPEGGAGGGRVIVAGPPEVVAACGESWTGQALSRVGACCVQRLTGV